MGGTFFLNIDKNISGDFNIDEVSKGHTMGLLDNLDKKGVVIFQIECNEIWVNK